MASSGSLLFFLGFISIAEIAFSVCVPPAHCIDDLEDSDTRERFDKVVAQYKQVNITIAGKPLGLHGKVISYNSNREYHLVFHYVDNTLHDVIQTCTFVVYRVNEECQTIRLYCSGFLKRPPRPLLKLKPLSVCSNDVQVEEEESETVTEPGVEMVSKEDQNAGASADPDSTKPPSDTTTRSSKFSLYN